MKLYLILISILFISASCSYEKKGNTQHSSESFCLTDTMKQKIKLDTVRLEQIQNELNLSGKIQALPSRNLKIYPLVSGLVKDVYVELGDYVEKGQPLAQIISSEVAEFEKELADAEANLQLAQKNLDVANDMFKSRLISEKELISAQKEVEKAQAEVKRLKSVFDIYQIDEQGFYTLKSPISGYIISKNISDGMQIRADNNQEILSIADISRLWVVANVYESDMQKVKKDQEALIYTIAYPDSIFNGKVNKIFEVLDPETRVMKIAIEIENKNGILKPEMYAQVKLYFTENRTLPTIPASAVIFDNSRYYALVYHTPCNIKVVPIEPEKINKHKAYIRYGLNNGEIIITKNNLLVYDAITEIQ